MSNVEFAGSCTKCGQPIPQKPSRVSGSDKTALRKQCYNCKPLVSAITIEDIRKLAQDRGGLLLSDTYYGKSFHLDWQCAKGHKWSAIYENVKNKNSWCPFCVNCRSERALDDVKALIETKGFICLSTEYKTVDTKLKLKCPHGHTWQATFDNVRNGSGCPGCSSALGERITRAHFEQLLGVPFPSIRPDWLLNSNGNKLELDGYNESLRLAFEHQGEQHYNPIEKMGGEETFKKLQKHDAEKRAICAAKGIKLIEVPAIPILLPLAKVRVFLLNEFSILGVVVPSPLPETIDLKQVYSYNDGVERMKTCHETAAKHGGKCLSPGYIGYTIPMKWECAKGHTWESAYQNVVAGSKWCMLCYRQRQQKTTIESCHEVAAANNGKCLTLVYTDVLAPMRWECEAGHVWNASYHRVKHAKAWCNQCLKLDRLAGK